jgi:hypothetical protein
MNTLVKGGLVAGGLMVAAAALVIGAGVAHAEPASSTTTSSVAAFQHDMDAYGFYNANGPSAQLGAGRGVCAKIAGGERPLFVALDVSDISSMTPYQSGEFVALSVKDLCPQFIPQVAADAN